MTMASDDTRTIGTGSPDDPLQPRRFSLEIGLATFESGPFLAELLDSLFAQSEQDFTLLVADDGSGDATVAILEHYAARHPGRIRIVARDRQPLGALGNFARLIDHARADYLMLCDHDDVWLPDKIALTLERMQALERVHGGATPLLVHTDLKVVDAELREIAPSLFRYSGIDPTRNDLRSLLTANVATGCTLLANRALYERARPVAPEAMMHDHWLALVAAALGRISCIATPTILYRQHGGNAIGAHSGGAVSLLERVRLTLFSNDRQRVMRRYSRQAAALLARYAEEMRADDRHAVETLATIWTVRPWRRFARLRRSGLGLRGFVRNAALFVVVTRDSPEG
jgi:glycosyltransferase involved in cell wall biosynthesis